MRFEPYPFEKLNNLIKDIIPSSEYEPISLTIGEPQFDTPSFIQEGLKNSTMLLNKYPKSAGEAYLKEAQMAFVKKRSGIELKPSELIPTFGTREVLFNFPQFLLHDTQNPKMAYPNPFYQIYEGAAIAARAGVYHLNLTKENGFKPVIDKKELKECNLVILNSPNNPTASVMSIDELCEWAELALELDFVLLNDECYSEIYTDEKPAGILEASKKIGNDSFKNILAINSISKRSSAPGLRSGFIAGDETILKNYGLYRTYIGCAIPLPLQRASALAWGDFGHSELIRKKYVKNYEIAAKSLGISSPKATFYLWLYVGDELEFTKRLYENYNTLVLPGSYLGRDGAGKGYVRVALVHEQEVTLKSMEIIKRETDKIA